LTKRGRRVRGWLVLGPLLFWLALVVEQSRGGGAVWVFSWAVELGVATAVLLAAWAVGRRLLAAIWPPARDRSGAVFVEMGLGLGAISLAVFALGTAGWIGRLSVAGGFLVGTVVGAIDLVPRIRNWIERDPEPGLRWRRGEAILVVLPLAWGFPYAAMPPVFYDAIVYHLGLPNLYLASGTLEYPLSFSLAGYPQNAELILLVALAAGNETAARLTGFLICALAALTVRGLVRERLGRVAGNLSYLILVSQWFFWFQAVFSKVDLIGAFFLLTMVSVILQTRRGDGIRPWIVAGLLAGFALGVKFANLLPIAVLTIASPWLFRPVRPATLRRAALVGVLALTVASPWMIRNMAHRGNPLFPAFYELLGGDGWMSHNAARMRAETGMNLDRSPSATFLRVTRIGWQGRYGSGGELSRVWIPLLLAGIVASRDRQLRWLLACAAVNLAVGVAFFTSYLRVHGFALIVVAIAAGVLWDRLRPKAVRWAFGLGSLIVIVYGFLFSAQLCDLVSGQGSRVITGRIGPRSYAEEQLNYLPLARYINENLDSTARIRLLGTARSAYIHRSCVASYGWDDPWLSRFVDPTINADRMIAELRAEGFTHALFDPAEMDRLERASGLFGYANSAGARERIDRFFDSLPLEAEANGVYLFRLADTPPDSSR
jgi:hypothetical protein